jgi:hypothetical protein
MHEALYNKIKAMLWDIDESSRAELANMILNNPVETFRNDNQLFIKALSSLKWYELIRLVGKQNLLELLTDPTIQRLYPNQRRIYYKNARRLLSEYSVSASGQSA